MCDECACLCLFYRCPSSLWECWRCSCFSIVKSGTIPHLQGFSVISARDEVTMQKHRDRGPLKRNKIIIAGASSSCFWATCLTRWQSLNNVFPVPQVCKQPLTETGKLDVSLGRITAMGQRMVPWLTSSSSRQAARRSPSI